MPSPLRARSHAPPCACVRVRVSSMVRACGRMACACGRMCRRAGVCVCVRARASVYFRMWVLCVFTLRVYTPCCALLPHCFVFGKRAHKHIRVGNDIDVSTWKEIGLEKAQTLMFERGAREEKSSEPLGRFAALPCRQGTPLKRSLEAGPQQLPLH
jgi:hypothetical protein